MSRPVTTLPVSACLVTKGDVDMQPILDSLPPEWEIVIWENGGQRTTRRPDGSWFIDGGEYTDHTLTESRPACADLSVYGRYAAIEHARHDLIYVQDDDVIVSDPAAVVDALWSAPCHACSPNREYHAPGVDPCAACQSYRTAFVAGEVVCNMPPEFRPHYPDSGLVGFGAAFHRDAPARAFERFWRSQGWGSHPLAGLNDVAEAGKMEFLRRCDNVFTTLTPIVQVDVPKVDREMASDPSRMWKQPGHTTERDRMIELARQVRDASV